MEATSGLIRRDGPELVELEASRWSNEHRDKKAPLPRTLARVLLMVEAEAWKWTRSHRERAPGVTDLVLLGSLCSSLLVSLVPAALGSLRGRGYEAPSLAAPAAHDRGCVSSTRPASAGLDDDGSGAVWDRWLVPQLRVPSLRRVESVQVLGLWTTLDHWPPWASVDSSVERWTNEKGLCRAQQPSPQSGRKGTTIWSEKSWNCGNRPALSLEPGVLACESREKSVPVEEQLQEVGVDVRQEEPEESEQVVGPVLGQGLG